MLDPSKDSKPTIIYSEKLCEIYPPFKDLNNLISHSIVYHIKKFIKPKTLSQPTGQVKKALATKSKKLNDKKAVQKETPEPEVKPKLIFGQDFLWTNLMASINFWSILKEFTFPKYNVCQKKFGYSETYVRCFDCDLTTNPNFHGLMCLNCYSKSNHKGHVSIYIGKSSSSTEFCDCGDNNVFDEKGFCDSHGKNPQISRDNIIEIIPSDLKLVIKNHLYEAFYVLFAVSETMIQYKDQLLKNYKDIPTQIFKEILIFMNCLCDKHSTMIDLMNQILTECLPKKFNELRHNCEDIKNIQINEENVIKDCKCTILENILRFQCLYSDSQCLECKQFLDKLTRDKNFEIYLTETYIKMYPFIFHNIVRESEYINNLQLEMAKIISKNTTVIKHIAASPYLNNIFNAYEFFFDKYDQKFDYRYINLLDSISNKVMPLLDSKEIVSGLFMNTNFLEKYIHFIERFWFKYIHNADQICDNDHTLSQQVSDQIYQIMNIEEKFLNIFDKLLQMIDSDNIALFNKLLSTLSQILYKGIVCIQEQNTKSKGISACNISPRLFAMTYRYLYEDINNDNIESFLILLFNNQDKFKWTEFFSMYLLEIMKYMMLSRHYKIKGYPSSWWKYVDPKYKFRKYDILYCQMAILYLDQNYIYDILFNRIFCYEKIEEKKEAKPENQADQNQQQQQVQQEPQQQPQQQPQQPQEVHEQRQPQQELPQQLQQEQQETQQLEPGQRLQQEQRESQQQPQAEHVPQQLQHQQEQPQQVQEPQQNPQQPQQEQALRQLQQQNLKPKIFILSPLMFKKGGNLDDCMRKGLDLVNIWLELLLFIMNDELSYYNTKANKIPLNETYKRIANNYIISVLQKEWLGTMNFSEFKKRLMHNISDYNKLENDNEVYTIYPYKKKAKVKEEYKNSYDFFYAYSPDNIYLFNTPILPHDIDLTIGSFIQRKNLPYAMEYILQIQAKIFSSKLPSEIMRLLTTYTTCKSQPSIYCLSNLYRIIHMHLDIITNPNIIMDNPKLIENFKDLYMNNKNDIDEIKSDLESKLKCHYEGVNSADIQILISRMNNMYLIQQETSIDMNDSPNKNHEFDEASLTKSEERKRLMEKKRREIEEAFKKKQEKGLKKYLKKQEANKNKNNANNNTGINANTRNNTNTNHNINPNTRPNITNNATNVNANSNTNIIKNISNEASTNENNKAELTTDLSQIPSTITNNASNTEEEANNCPICSEKIEEKFFVMPLHINQANFDINLNKYLSYDLCLKELKDGNLDENKVIEEVFKSTNPDINKYSSCWHLYHRKCFLNYSSCQYCKQNFDAIFYNEEYPDIKWPLPKPVTLAINSTATTTDKKVKNEEIKTNTTSKSGLAVKKLIAKITNKPGKVDGLKKNAQSPLVIKSYFFNSIFPEIDNNDKKIPIILNFLRKMIIELLNNQPVILDYGNYINKYLYLYSRIKNEFIKYLIYLCRFYKKFPILHPKTKNQNIFKYFNSEFCIESVESNNANITKECGLENEEGKKINPEQKTEIKPVKKIGVTNTTTTATNTTLNAKSKKTLVSSSSQKTLITSVKASIGTKEPATVKTMATTAKPTIAVTTKNQTDKKVEITKKIPVKNTPIPKTQVATTIPKAQVAAGSKTQVAATSTTTISNTQNNKTTKPTIQKSSSQQTLSIRPSTTNANTNTNAKVSVVNKSLTNINTKAGLRPNSSGAKNISPSIVSARLSVPVNTNTSSTILLEPSFTETVDKEIDSITTRNNQLNLNISKLEEEEDEKENMNANLPKQMIENSYVALNLESIIEEEPMNALNTIKLIVDFPQENNNNTTTIIQENISFIPGDIEQQGQKEQEGKQEKSSLSIIPPFLEKTIIQNEENIKMMIELWNGDINSQYAKYFYNYYTTCFIKDKIIDDKYYYHNLSFTYPTYYLYVIFLKCLPEIFTEEHFVNLDKDRVKSMLVDIKDNEENYKKLKENLLKACKFLLPLIIFHENIESTLKKSASFDLNDPSKLISFIIPDLTINTLLDVIYPKYLEEENYIFNIWKTTIHHNNNNNNESTLISKISTSYISTIIDLPPNLHEFNLKYQKSKCELDGSINRNLLLCLLCGYICCVKACMNKFNKIGNMHTHIENVHANQGIWLDLGKLHIEMHVKKLGDIRVSNRIYLNNFGNSHFDLLNDGKLDLSIFKLDNEIINTIKRAISQSRFTQEIQNLINLGVCHGFYSEGY